MSQKFDFIVIGGHGSGLNAFHYFINLLPGVKCIYPGNNTQAIIDLVNEESDIKKGLLIDSCAIKQNQILSFVLNNLSPHCLLIVLNRDPCKRIKSVVNTHIQWWADAVSGTYELALKETLLYSLGDAKSLLQYMLTCDYMNTVVELYDIFAKKCKKSLFFDISDLYPENILTSLQMICKIINHDIVSDLTIPQSLPFSRQNRFVIYVKHLYLSFNHVNVALKCCPVEFCDLYNCPTERQIVTFSQDDIHFGLGDFKGNVAFVLDPLLTPELSKEILLSLRECLNTNSQIIYNFVDDLNKRHSFANEIASHVYLTNDKILKYCSDNRILAAKMYDFITSQLIVMGNVAHKLVKNWDEAIKITNKLRRMIK